jgi:hypothetical protein
MHSADSLTLALAGIGDGLLGKGMALASCDPVRQARRLAKPSPPSSLPSGALLGA